MAPPLGGVRKGIIDVLAEVISFMQKPDAIAEKHWLSALERLRPHARGNSWQELEKRDFWCDRSKSQNNWTPFFAIRIVLMFKTVFKIVIFQKIVDGDPTKITKMSRKIDTREAIVEKHWFSASERLRPHARGNSWQELKKCDFLCENHRDRSKS